MTMMNPPMHTIQFAARHSGLSPHTIRAWERRYSALAPDRTAANRRLYSVEDLDKLALLNRAVQSGHRIGQIAALSIPELQKLPGVEATSQALGGEQAGATTGAATGTTASPFLEECRHAVAALDGDALEYGLTRAAALQGAATMIDRVALP